MTSINTIADIELGVRYKDTATGFTGLATARIEYLNGCLQAQLVAPGKDGAAPISEWVDHQRLAFVDRKYLKAAPKGTGGPGPTGIPGLPTP